MAEHSIQEWLADYTNLSPVEEHSFATSLTNSYELIYAIFSVLEDRAKHELLEPICNQLFSFYRSQEVELHHFVIQYVPTLIGVYLTSLGQPELKTHKTIELLILGIYNLDVVTAHGKPQSHSFQLPSLAQPSIYHESLSTITTTDNLLRGMDKTELHVVTLGPFPQVELLNGQNRLRVMTILMNTYNAYLSFIPKPSLRFMCKMCSKLVKQGFARQGHFQRSSYGSDNLFTNLAYQRANQRLSLSAAFLLEVLHAVYFAMYNGHYQVAVQALDDIHTRATYELYVEVLLVTNAIRSSLKLSPSGQALEGPMGINVALSPSTATPSLSKAIITNASFRTKKLPDDIPIQDGEKPMATISEEQEEQVSTGDKEKDKDKDKVPRPPKVKDKMSVGNLIAKAKAIRKDDSSPSTSKSKEKSDSRKKIDVNDSVTSVKSAKFLNGEHPEMTRSVDSGKSKLEGRQSGSGKTDEKSGEVAPRRLSDGFLSDTGKTSSTARKTEMPAKLTPKFTIDGNKLGARVVDASSAESKGSGKSTSTAKSTTSRHSGSRASDGLRGGEFSKFDVSRSADTVYVDKNEPDHGLTGTFSETVSARLPDGHLGETSRRSDEPAIAILRMIDGRIADITRSVESGRLTNGKSNSRADNSDVDNSESSDSQMLDYSKHSDEEETSGNQSSESYRMGDIPRLSSDRRRLEKRKSDEAMLATTRLTDEQRIAIRSREKGVVNNDRQQEHLPAGEDIIADGRILDGNTSTRDNGQRMDLLKSLKYNQPPSPLDKQKPAGNTPDSGDLSRLDVLPRRDFGRDQFDDGMELKLLPHGSRVELSDSSEETEQSYSLDVSYSCSNFTDSEEDIPHKSRTLDQKVQRESVHTFV